MTQQQVAFGKNKDSDGFDRETADWQMMEKVAEGNGKDYHITATFQTPEKAELDEQIKADFGILDVQEVKIDDNIT